MGGGVVKGTAANTYSGQKDFSSFFPNQFVWITQAWFEFLSLHEATFKSLKPDTFSIYYLVANYLVQVLIVLRFAFKMPTMRKISGHCIWICVRKNSITIQYQKWIFGQVTPQINFVWINNHIKGYADFHIPLVDSFYGKSKLEILYPLQLGEFLRDWLNGCFFLLCNSPSRPHFFSCWNLTLFVFQFST